jgi:hypothetical protein
MPTRYVPPSGFGYPLDGLLPANPCRFCFAPAALLGFSPSEDSLTKGIRGVTTRMNPHTVRPFGIPAAEAPGRHERLRFLGFNPFESPNHPGEGLVRRPIRTSLGVHPSRVCRQKPWPEFRPTSSLALGFANDDSLASRVPQSISQLLPRLSLRPHLRPARKRQPL